MELMKTFRFEASHILPKHPGKCSRLHGHSWVLRVFVKGPINQETGFVMDYAEISDIVKPLIERLDHRHLGAWTDLFYKPMLDRHRHCMVPDMPEDFYPSSENLLYWIGRELRGVLRVKEGFRGTTRHEIDQPSMGLDWSKIALEETCTSYAELTREEFESADGSYYWLKTTNLKGG